MHMRNSPGRGLPYIAPLQSSFPPVMIEQCEMDLITSARYKWNLIALFDRIQPYVLSTQFTQMFTVQDILSIRITCKYFHKLFDEKYILKAIALGNLNPELRPKFWLREAPFFTIQNEYRKRLQLPSIFDNVYEHLQREIENDESIQKALARHKMDIKKDLNRTMNEGRIGTEEGQQELNRILIGMAYCYQEIGYCQGMNFIGGVLLVCLQDEELAFWVFCSIMDKFVMRNMFLPGVPDLHIKNFQMSQLIQKNLPQLYNHFRHINMSTDYFTSKWLMTIFACYLPLSTTLVAYDLFFLSGWKSVFQIGIALLQQLAPKFLTMEMGELSTFLRNTVRTKIIDEKQLFLDALTVNINNDELEEMVEKYYIKQAELKIESNKSQWEPDQIDVIQWAKTKFERLDPLTKSDVSFFQKKIEDYDKELEVANKCLANDLLQYNTIKNEFENLKDKGNILKLTQMQLKQQIDVLGKEVKQKQPKISIFQRLFKGKKNNSSVRSSSMKKPMKGSIRGMNGNNSFASTPNSPDVKCNMKEIPNRNKNTINNKCTRPPLHNNTLIVQKDSHIRSPNIHNPLFSPRENNSSNPPRKKDATRREEDMVEELSLFKEDFELIRIKLEALLSTIDIVNDEYDHKRSMYERSLSRQQELQTHKELAMNQLNSLLMIYEEQRTSTYKKVVEQLKKTNKFINTNMF